VGSATRSGGRGVSPSDAGSSRGVRVGRGVDCGITRVSYAGTKSATRAKSVRSRSRAFRPSSASRSRLLHHAWCLWPAARRVSSVSAGIRARFGHARRFRARARIARRAHAGRCDGRSLVGRERPDTARPFAPSGQSTRGLMSPPRSTGPSSRRRRRRTGVKPKELR